MLPGLPRRRTRGCAGATCIRRRAFPYERLRRRERAARHARTRSSSCSTPASSTTAATWTITAEYAKAVARRHAHPDHGRATPGPRRPRSHLLPTLWFRNTWSWEPGGRSPGDRARPAARARSPSTTTSDGVRLTLRQGAPEALFSDNETNAERLFGAPRATPYVKDAFHDHVVAASGDGESRARRAPRPRFATRSTRRAPARARRRCCGCARCAAPAERSDDGFDAVDGRRRQPRPTRSTPSSTPAGASDDEALVQRQAFAGLLWTKQFYHYDVRRAGSTATRPSPPPPPRRARAQQRVDAPQQRATSSRCRTSGSTPGTPRGTSPSTASRWRSSIPSSPRQQLILLLREWYMHPNGQLPAYEWEFGDVNPPVHAWAALRVYQIDAGDRASDRRSSSACSTSCCSTSPGG